MSDSKKSDETIYDFMRRTKPDRLPVTLQTKNPRLPTLSKKKFLFPANVTIVDVVHMVRIKLALADMKHKTIFLLTENGVLLQPSTTIMSVCNTHAPDRILNLYYDVQDTFG